MFNLKQFKNFGLRTSGFRPKRWPQRAGAKAFVEEHSNTDRTPYLFNGKELDEETGLYYYGAWYYEPQISVWLSVDPEAEQFINISAYAYCANNPVKHIDPDGRKYLNFDEDGNYINTTKDNWFHNFFVGTKGQIVDGKGSATRTFGFSDPKNDASDIQKGIIKKILFVKEKDIQSMISKSGAFDHKNRTESKNITDRYDYIKKAGEGGQPMDFSYTQIPEQYSEASMAPNAIPASVIFLVDDMAYNQSNFGNFLFGAAGHSLGYTKPELKAGAHYNSLFNSDKNGYESQWDSADDQYSIERGVYHSVIQGYRDKTMKGGKIVDKKR